MKNQKKQSQKNTLYTGYGDNGTTTLFNCNQTRISKSSNIIEALGSLDELNAFLGIVKVYAGIEQIKIKISKRNEVMFSSILDDIQQKLFIIQAEIAGSVMTIKKNDLNKIEKIISIIGEILPPITSFTISGGSILSAELDYSRTLSRRSERCIISVVEEGHRKVGKITIAYLNRLSSVLFAMSRYSNYLLSIKEDHPTYNK